MTLLLILIAIGVQRFLQFSSQPFHVDWIGGYYRWCERKIEYVTEGHGLLGFGILVVPMLFIASIIFSIMFHVFGSFGYWVVSLVLFWYCIDARDLVKQPYSGVGPVNLLIEVYRALYGMIFWFTLFGPVGLVLYYVTKSLNSYFQQHLRSEAKELGFYAQRVLAVLDWIPVRLFTLSFALVGHFASVFKLWMKSLLGGFDVEMSLITQCGQAVVNTAEDAIALLNRVLIVWLVVIALVTIGLVLG